MGCGGSKFEESEVVALCRDRRLLLADAIHYRYALAEAHAAYSRSLRSSGASIHHLLDALRSLPPPAGDVPPLLPLPPVSSSASAVLHSETDEDDESPLHSTGSSPLNLHHDNDVDEDTGPTFVNHSYSRNRPSDASVYSYPTQNPNFYASPKYASYSGIGGFFESASPPPYIQSGGTAESPSLSSRAPSPPPKASTWDFLNPFESYRSSLREEEWIPDLEGGELEVVKEAYGEKKSATSSSAVSATEEFDNKVVGTGEEDIAAASMDPQCKPKRSMEGSTGVDCEVNVVDKNVVTNEVKVQEREQQHPEARAVVDARRYDDLSDVVAEIKTQFDKASESFNEVSKMLEVGKILYQQKNSVYEAVSTKMICGVSSTSNDVFLEFEEEKVAGSWNLSSTLQKLYMWERKLYDEVKDEEKMRGVLERECEHLRRLDERGAEAHKLDAALNFIRKLSTKIRISVRVVESISNKINTLRDEELWPQITEVIQGLMTTMWRVMLECHRTQYQAISEATTAAGGRLSDAHMETVKQLELELLDLITCFSVWINTQKSFVKALNGWLLKGLDYVPEETTDGVAPFSPGRLGAPPVFIICNYWSQTIDRISEREVVDTMQAFASDVLSLWGQHNFERRQRLMANSDMDRTLKIMEREELRMQKTVEEQSKKLVLVTGNNGVTLSRHLAHGGIRKRAVEIAADF